MFDSVDEFSGLSLSIATSKTRTTTRTEIRTFNNHTCRTLNAKCRDDGPVVALLASGRGGRPPPKYQLSPNGGVARTGTAVVENSVYYIVYSE